MNSSNRSVLVVTSEFPPLPGGIGNHAFNLCKQLVSHGYHVTVLTNERSLNDEQFTLFLKQNANMEILALKRASNPLSTYIQRVQLYRELLSKKPDHIFFSGKFSIWLAGLGWHKAKAWAVIHGSEIKQQGIKRFIFKRGLDNVDGIISVSSFTQEFLLKEFNHVDINKCHVINNGFELAQGVPSNRNVLPGECRLLTVGGMHKRKGQHNVIHAIPYLIQKLPHFHYTMAGLPETMPALQQLANNLGVEKYVTFVPNPSNDALVELIHKNQLFAMLSENLPNGDIEGFGIAILEAMSLGLPAIGSKNSGIRDAIDHTKSGVLIDDIHNPEEIYEAIKRILDNYTSYSSCATQWSAHFRWSSVIQQYLQIIEPQ